MTKTVTIHTRSSFWSSRESHDEIVVDSDDLAVEVEFQCNLLEKEGYIVQQIIPVNSGNQVAGNGGYYTESVVIVAVKKK
ncbi:MAG TPA: hypothetical protein PLD12_08010 [Bacteroidales bacterium]|nr:hypothetical protein [Bacteroidales bacterium]HPO66052.1 hypothetical protein [Bacteroidales bacterium]